VGVTAGSREVPGRKPVLGRKPVTRATMMMIVVVIIIITISFMQGIYTYIPETNNVPKQYNVAAILSLLFMVPISLAAGLALMYFYISTF
jgi:hypothetical protein